MIESTKLVVEKHSENIRKGLKSLSSIKYGLPKALGNSRWTPELILTTYEQASTGKPPQSGLEFKIGASEGGFDR